MASVWKHPKSKYWSACFTDSSGRQRKRSTKLTDRKKALKIAEKLEEEYRNHRAEEQTRKVLADIRIEIHGETKLNQPIESYFREWLTSRKGEIGPSTWKKYEHASKHFCEWLGELQRKDLSIITPTLIRQWRDSLVERLAPKTVNNMLRVIGVAMSYAYVTEQISSNPVDKVPTLRLDDIERRAFTMDEIKKVLKFSQGEWRGIVLTGLYTGQRLGDIARLTWGKVDMEQRELTIKTGKTRRTVNIPIAEPLFAYLAKLPEPIDGGVPVFPESFAIVEKEQRTSSLSTKFHKILVNAGLAEPHSKKKTGSGHSVPRKRGGLSFHCLRHTATSLLKNAGVSEAVAMDIIGHDSKAVSSAYTHIDTQAKRSAIEKLPDVTLS